MTPAGLSGLVPGRIVGHVDVFKRDEESGEQMLVSTTRPCSACGGPLTGVIVPDGDKQRHLECPTIRRADGS